MPHGTRPNINQSKELQSGGDGARKFALHYFPATAMAFSKTRKKLPPQIFSISRSV